MLKYLLAKKGGGSDVSISSINHVHTHAIPNTSHTHTHLHSTLTRAHTPTRTFTRARLPCRGVPGVGSRADHRSFAEAGGPPRRHIITFDTCRRCRRRRRRLGRCGCSHPFVGPSEPSCHTMPLPSLQTSCLVPGCDHAFVRLYSHSFFV